MKWETENFHGIPHQIVHGKACTVYLESRPPYCDRGNFIAKIFLREGATTAQAIELNLDEQDGWPRYYFDEARAKAEVEAWLTKRKQALPDSL